MGLRLTIRHGERDTPPDFLPGHLPGIRLTAEGHAQAARIARRLARERVDRIVSSPLERAQQTAAPLAAARRLAIETNPAFIEMDFGRWAGKRTPELEHDPEWQQFNRTRSTATIPGGDTALAVQGRFVGELLRMRAAYPGDSIACFTRADPIRYTLLYFLGAPLDACHRLDINVGSISTVELTEWGARVIQINEVPVE